MNIFDLTAASTLTEWELEDRLYYHNGPITKAAYVRHHIEHIRNESYILAELD